MAGFRPSLVAQNTGAAPAAPAVPAHVVLVGLGPSLEAYVDIVKRIGNRRWFADEVWAINATADIFQCDRVFHMDDVRIQEMRADLHDAEEIAAKALLADTLGLSADEIAAHEKTLDIHLEASVRLAIKLFAAECDRSEDDPLVVEFAAARVAAKRQRTLENCAHAHKNIRAMLQWLKKHPGPVYTSRSHPDYPGLVDYPLADVMNACGGLAYFNSTLAYAVAYALFIGVKKITLFGCDFSYANSHQAEQGRGCVEFYLGMFRARGGIIGLPNSTSLMDAVATNGQRLYGYDTVDVAIDHDADDKIVLNFTERAVLPTAAEIERRYDHSQPTSPHVRAAKAGA